MRICTRYDIPGIIDVKERMFGLKYKEGYLHFYEWVDKPGYYLICEHDEDEGGRIYQHLTNTGECDYGDGCGRANVAIPVSIGIFENYFRWRFLDYFKEHYISETLPCKFSIGRGRGWYKIEELNLQKWLDEFILIEQKRIEEREAELRNQEKPRQLNLF